MEHQCCGLGGRLDEAFASYLFRRISATTQLTIVVFLEGSYLAGHWSGYATCAACAEEDQGLAEEGMAEYVHGLCQEEIS